MKNIITLFKQTRRISMGSRLLIFVLSSAIGKSASAQLTLSSANTTGTYTNNVSITLAPGFTSQAPFIASIGQTAAVPAPSQNLNYVLTYTPRIAITNASLLPSSTIANVNQSIQYFDGLGRPIQNVQIQASPTQRDLVQPMSYDQYGREATKYLPYSVLPSSASDGSYKTTALTDQASFYANPTNTSTWNAPGVSATGFPMSSSTFDSSPLDRLLEQGAAGDSWQLTGTAGAPNPGHTVKTVYATNNASSLTTGTGYWAKNFGVNYVYTYDGHYLFKTTLSDLGSCPADMLYVTISKNENWSSSQTNVKLNTTEEYKDKFGHILLRRTFNYNANTNQTETLSTYYVYDDISNLTYVLPPGANPDAGSITQATLDTWCYQYRYDGRNRLIEKKIPGKGWELTLYNNLDQPVATQDSVQRMKSPQEFKIIKYDAMGRTVLTGIYQYSGSTAGTDYRATLQSLVDAQSSQWESVSTGGNGYTATTWPTTWTTTLTLNYYDNYTSIPAGLPYSYTGGSNMTRGKLTTTKTGVLNTSDMLWTQHFYDDNDWIIKSYQQHFFGGASSVNNYDDITNHYDFTGAPLSTIRKNYVNGTGNALNLYVTITDSLTYDQVGRKTNSFIKVNTGANVLLANYVYNEVGQLYKKKLHSEDNGINFIETVTYSYNPRGWATEINSAHFDEKLYYDTPSGTISGLQGLYNGNILEAWYNSPSITNKGFSYAYDNLNRLTNAKYYQSGTYNGALDEGANYDLTGNIVQLTRGSYGSPGFTYSGTFSFQGYTGNQVGNITNNGSAFRAYTYDGNGNSITAGTFSYNYNMLNLPNNIKLNNTIFNTYAYDATGTKLRKVSTASTFTTDYINGIQYRNGAIDFIETEEGRYEYSSSPVFQYNLKDHLGNSRVIIQKNTATTATTEQENEYYAFGLNVNRYDNSTQNKYLYNHKELQDENNLNQYDYGARFYDPVIGRFNTIDPLAEKDRRWSSYSYGHNNPISHIDVDGMFDWVKDQDGDIKWDKNAKSQATTKEGETYLGKDLKFTFNSYINNTFDGPNPPWGATGDKLTSTINLTSQQDADGNLTSVSVKSSYNVAATGGLSMFKGRNFFPGLGDDQNKGINISNSTGFNATFEQHASVPGLEAAGLALLGYSAVNVAQKLTLRLSGNNLSVSAGTDVFPSATLSVNGNQLFQYNQPSFKATHGNSLIDFGSSTRSPSIIHRPAPNFYNRYNSN